MVVSSLYKWKGIKCEIGEKDRETENMRETGTQTKYFREIGRKGNKKENRK